MRSTNILIILVALNSAALLVGAVGVGQDVGYQPTVGGDSQIDDANSSADSVSSNRGAFDSFVGAVITAAQTLMTIFGVVTAGPRMVMNLGVPSAIVVPLAAPLYILVGIDLLEIISGRSLT